MHGPDNSPGEPAEGAGIEAGGLGLKGPRGWAFRDVSVTAGPGSLIAVEGPSGSGRTTLLLALTGRMRTTEGTATVGGAPLPRRMAAVRAMSGLAHVPEVNDLEPALTVGEHLRERALLQRQFGGPVRALLHPREHSAAVRRQVEAAVAAAGLDLDALPKGARTAVRDLERLEELRLSVALALVGRPRLLAVDDTDLKLSDTDRARVWDLLRSVAASGTTVLAVCSEPPPGSAGAIVVSTGDTRTADAGGATTTTPTSAPTTGLRRTGRFRVRTNTTTGSRANATTGSRATGTTRPRAAGEADTSPGGKSDPSSTGSTGTPPAERTTTKPGAATARKTTTEPNRALPRKTVAEPSAAPTRNTTTGSSTTPARSTTTEPGTASTRKPVTRSTPAQTTTRPSTKRTETHPTTARTSAHPALKQPATVTTTARATTPATASTPAPNPTDTEEVTDAHAATRRA